MAEIAILLPTYGRPNALKGCAENIHAMTKTPHKIYFICERNDPASIDAATALHEECLIVTTGAYVAAINTGFRSTREPYVFCASDDVEFTKDWDTQMLPYFDDPAIGIVGARDDWTISKTEKHASHFMVRRAYIEKYSGVLDERNVIYSSSYIHSMCDIETEQTAMGRRAFALSPAIVHHHHWFMKDRPMDATYKRASDALSHDMASYELRRKSFELYRFEDLFAGNVVRVKKGGLTVVIPSFNQLPYLKQTVESLKKQTYSPYELIIIDDNSNEETRNYINSLDCIKVFNKKQKYVNHAWNQGIAMASNEFVCVANNDITFSKHWDQYLMQMLEDEDVWIANPYQSDDGWRGEPYGQHERAGNIAIRGACFMLKKSMFDVTGFIPKDYIIWFGDYWLTEQCRKHGKKTLFHPKSVIHHYGSKSSVGMMQEQKELFNHILRGDAYAFGMKEGINVDKWIKIIYDRLELPISI